MSVQKVLVLLRDVKFFRRNAVSAYTQTKKLQDKKDIKEWFVIKCFNLYSKKILSDILTGLMMNNHFYNDYFPTLTH